MTKYDVSYSKMTDRGRKSINDCPGVENGEEGAFGGDKNVLKWDYGGVC